MNWDDLRFCLAIARAGSLAGAARTLAVNHSTVFRRLEAFEDKIGVRVFERLPQGYVPTAEGEEILRHAESADAAVLALERTVAGKDYRLSGRIRLTTAPNLAAGYVARYLPGFLDLYPDIRIEIASGDREFDLARREADLALRATAQPPEYLVGRRVCEAPWWVFAGERYLEAHRPPASMEDLGRHPLIGPEASFLRLPAFAWLQAQYGESAFVACASELNTMAALAHSGIGLAVLPIDQQGPGLVPLFALEPAFEGALWLLTHPDLRHVARIRAFSDYLIERLRGDARLQPPS
jgi:DNA-binding transcriptional LysR family regulator